MSKKVPAKVKKSVVSKKTTTAPLKKTSAVKKPTTKVARTTKKIVVKATKDSARAFIQRAQLPTFARTRASRAAPAPIDFDQMKQQAAVVGSSVVSFDEGVMPETREDICNTTLFAQLVATKKVPDTANVFGWFDEYLKTLMRVGWLVQESGFKVYNEEMDGLETHQAILNVASLFLGGAPSAIALIKGTLDAMQSMDKDNPWITIFDRETRSAKTGHFQMALAGQDKSGKLTINLLAFTLEASTQLTQVLFFRLWKNKATFKHNGVNATINRSVLASVREILKKKLAEQITDFIATAEI